VARLRYRIAVACISAIFSDKSAANWRNNYAGRSGGSEEASERALRMRENLFARYVTRQFFNPLRIRTEDDVAKMSEK